MRDDYHRIAEAKLNDSLLGSVGSRGNRAPGLTNKVDAHS